VDGRGLLIEAIRWQPNDGSYYMKLARTIADEDNETTVVLANGDRRTKTGLIVEALRCSPASSYLYGQLYKCMVAIGDETLEVPLWSGYTIGYKRARILVDARLDLMETDHLDSSASGNDDDNDDDNDDNNNDNNNDNNSDNDNDSDNDSDGDNNGNREEEEDENGD